MKFKNEFLHEDGIYYIPGLDLIFALAWAQKKPIPTFYTITEQGMGQIPLSFLEEVFYQFGIERIGDLEDIEHEVLEPEEDEDECCDCEEEDEEEELTNEELDNVKIEAIKNTGNDNIQQ